MSGDTVKRIAEILLVLVAGYFSLWAALLTIVTISNILFSERTVSLETVIQSVVYFIAWVICAYIARTALKAARRGGEWTWR